MPVSDAGTCGIVEASVIEGNKALPLEPKDLCDGVRRKGPLSVSLSRRLKLELRDLRPRISSESGLSREFCASRMFGACGGDDEKRLMVGEDTAGAGEVFERVFRCPGFSGVRGLESSPYAGKLSVEGVRCKLCCAEASMDPKLRFLVDEAERQNDGEGTPIIPSDAEWPKLYIVISGAGPDE